MDWSTRSTNNILTVLAMSVLLVTSVKAMRRRNQEIPSTRAQPSNPRSTTSRIPESAEGTLNDSVSRLNIDTRPRTSSRFPYRKPSRSEASENNRLSLGIDKAQNVASTSGKVGRSTREISNIQKLNLRKDVSPEEDTMPGPSRTDTTDSRSTEREFKSIYGTDGSWEYARRMQREKRLNAFCTSVQLINGGGFSLVNGAYLTSGLLNLGSETINADMIRFTTTRRPHYTYYITKGLHADCVFTLTKKPRTGVFTLGKHICRVEGPSPGRTRVMERALHRGESTARALIFHWEKLFGLLNESNSNNM